MTKNTLRKFAIALKPALTLSLVVVISIATWLMDRDSLRVEYTVYLFSYGFYANAFPVVLMFLLVLLAINRLFLSALVTLGAITVIYLANGEKMRELLHPIVLSDLHILRSMNGSVLHLLGNYFKTATLWSASAGLLAIVTVFMFEPRFIRGCKALRATAFAMLIFMFAGLTQANGWATRYYTPEKLRVVAWSASETQLHSGLFGSLIHALIDSRKTLSQPVDYAGIERFLNIKMQIPAPHDTRASIDARPDILVVQSESFFDPVILSGMQDTDGLLPNLHRAQALGYGGSMKVPTFGGGTLRTEFEVLAGVPMSAIPELKYPYLQLQAKVLPSIAREVHEAGYKTYAVHPNDPSFWNRQVAFQAMGFDAFYSEKDFPANARRDGLYISDEAMTNKIIEILDRASTPAFVMAISIEAHGPYGSNPVSDEVMKKQIPTPGSWPKQAVNEYQAYAYHIHHADHELGRLWDYLKGRNKPFVLIFYGDHLPSLPEVYRAAGSFKNGSGAKNQSVPWLLITDRQTSRERPRNIRSWMIGGQALCAAGIKPPEYYALLNRAAAALSVSDADERRKDVLDGINALSILHLNSQSLPKNALSAAAQSGCFPMEGGASNDVHHR